MHLSLLLMCKLHRICHSLQWWYDYWPQTDHTAQAPSDRPAKKWHVWEKLDSTCFLITALKRIKFKPSEAPTWFTQSASCKIDSWVDVTTPCSDGGWELSRGQMQWPRRKLFGFWGRSHRLAVWLKSPNSCEPQFPHSQNEGDSVCLIPAGYKEHCFWSAAVYDYTGKYHSYCLMSFFTITPQDISSQVE